MVCPTAREYLPCPRRRSEVGCDAREVSTGHTCPVPERVLSSSGWFPGRRTDIGVWKERLSGFSWHPAAERFLTEFGGVSVEVSGSGVDVAREPFDLDP
ncbi:SUKH-3 domain-containing protein [Streptomyces sp. SS7]|uniref:SUKH-3 domain-containing protein n=1 Tax=Streptomyces sp. SS7 TaxID=3108485 RepID=UPI0030EE2543